MAKKTGSMPSRTPTSVTVPTAQRRLSSLRNDIETFLTKWKDRVFYNERDLQINLAIWLKRNCWDVDVEYFVPREAFDISQPLLPYKYVWDNDMKLDIVVNIENLFYIIELKYKTKAIDTEICRFNENMKVSPLKDQSAKDIACYEFWKDVRRIELVKSRFNNVVGGFAIFISNDNSYMNQPAKRTPVVNYLKFSMEDGIMHGIDKFWIRPAKINNNNPFNCSNMGKNKYPNFQLSACYQTDWREMKDLNANNDNYCFHYCIVELPISLKRNCDWGNRYWIRKREKIDFSDNTNI